MNNASWWWLLALSVRHCSTIEEILEQQQQVTVPAVLPSAGPPHTAPGSHGAFWEARTSCRHHWAKSAHTRGGEESTQHNTTLAGLTSSAVSSSSCSSGQYSSSDESSSSSRSMSTNWAVLCRHRQTDRRTESQNTLCDSRGKLRAGPEASPWERWLSTRSSSPSGSSKHRVNVSPDTSPTHNHTAGPYLSVLHRLPQSGPGHLGLLEYDRKTYLSCYKDAEEKLVINKVNSSLRGY